MHSTDRSGTLVKGKVALGDRWVQTAGLEFTPAIGACEKAAGVLMRFQVDKEGALKWSFSKNHLAVLVVSFPDENSSRQKKF